MGLLRRVQERLSGRMELAWQGVRGRRAGPCGFTVHTEDWPLGEVGSLGRGPCEC